MRREPCGRSGITTSTTAPPTTRFTFLMRTRWPCQRNRNRMRMRRLSPNAASSSYQPTVAAAGDPSPADARQQIPVVLIYRDGHEQEVSNYAIIGQTLYDLGTFVAHKIPLADLNLKATIKANDDRGVEFTVPASLKTE